jgi:nucleoside-diphosphate-sugar epimerase
VSGRGRRTGLYLVTGAGGFVGSALCRFLQGRGCGVRALLRRPAEGPWDERVVCDLSAEGLPAGVTDGVDGVFHLAGIAHLADISGVPEALYRRVNVQATGRLLEAAAASGTGRLVYFSSVKAAADPGRRCVDESWDEPPEDAYGRSKLEAERLVLAAGGPAGMHVCNLRPTLVYGPGVKGNLARMIEAVERGVFPPLPEFGNRRSMIGLDDLIEAAWLAMQDPRASDRTYILCDGVDYSTRALYLAIREALGRPAPRWALPRPILRAGALAGDVLGRALNRPVPLDSRALERLSGWACYSAGRIRAELGWAPRQTFFDALPQIVARRASAAGAGDEAPADGGTRR